MTSTDATPRIARFSVRGNRLVGIALSGVLVMTAGACRDVTPASPSPTPIAIATAAPTVAPTPTATPEPTATPTPTALPTRPPGGGGAIAEAAVAKLQADPLIAHVEQTQTLKAGGQDVTIASSSDFSGPDFRVVITINAGDQSNEQEIVVVGGEAWARNGAAGTLTSVPFAALEETVAGLYKAVRLVDDPEALRFVGVETIDGKKLQHLTANGTIPYIPAAGGTGQYDLFDLYVLKDGTPVIARTKFSATSAIGVDASGSTDFTFSKWGGPIAIEPPAGP